MKINSITTTPDAADAPAQAQPLNEREADRMFYEHQAASETEKEVRAIAADIGWANLEALVDRLSPAAPTQAQHSPLPWFVTRGNEIGYDGKDASGNRHVGYVAETLKRNQYGRADAEFIVRACNNYEQMEQLVEAARISDKAARRVEAELRAHAQRLADALTAIEQGLNTVEDMARRIIKNNGIANSVREKSDWARTALAQWNGGAK